MTSNWNDSNNLIAPCVYGIVLQERKRPVTLTMNARYIDFHSHFYDPIWFSSPAIMGQGILARAWPLLTDIEAQLAAMDSANIDAKVLSAPSALLVEPGKQLPPTMMARINNLFAELVSTYPEHLLALATIDAFQGDAAAHEVERAIQKLGLGGICIDCAQGDRFLDAPEVRPTLEAAAKLGVVVFVHPVGPIGLTERLSRLGHTGTLLARGTENAASLLALLRSGILDELPDLKVVLPMIGAAVFLFAGIAQQDYKREEGWRGASPRITRQRLYVDTMGFDPATIRFAIDLLGSEHVLVGSDWPIMPIAPRQYVNEVLAKLDLTEQQMAAILAGNTIRLLRPHITTFH
jgi:predicted TIM-barrel fold metal-dependent hydrolase